MATTYSQSVSIVAGGIPTGAVKVAHAAGAAAGDVTVTGPAVGDELVYVGVFTTAASIATFANLTAEFTITGTDTLNNVGGSSTANNQLLVLYIDKTA